MPFRLGGIYSLGVGLEISLPTGDICENSTRNSSQIVHGYPARRGKFSQGRVSPYPGQNFSDMKVDLQSVCSYSSVTHLANADAMVSPQSYETCLQPLESYNIVQQRLTYNLLFTGVNKERAEVRHKGANC